MQSYFYDLLKFEKGEGSTLILRDVKYVRQGFLALRIFGFKDFWLIRIFPTGMLLLYD